MDNINDLLQIVELSKQIALTSNEQPEQKNIGKILKRMIQKKDISKYYSFLSQIINQGIRERLLKYQRVIEGGQLNNGSLVTDCKINNISYDICQLGSIIKYHKFKQLFPLEHCYGVEQLAQAINSYGRFALKFLVNQPVSQTLITAFQHIYGDLNQPFDTINPQAFQLLHFKFQYCWNSQINNFNFNEKDLYTMVKQTQRIDQDLIDSLVHLLSQDQHISETTINILFDLLDKSRLPPNNRLIGLLDQIAQNNQMKIWEFILNQQYFESSIQDDNKFSYIIDFLLKFPKEIEIKNFNNYLNSLERVSKRISSQRHGEKFMQLVSYILQSNKLGQISIPTLLNIIKQLNQNDKSGLRLTYPVFLMLRDYILQTPRQPQSSRVFIMDFLELILWIDYCSVVEGILEVVRAQSMNALMCQVVASLLFRCQVASIEMLQRELQRLLLETPYVNTYTLYLFHVLNLKNPGVNVLNLKNPGVNIAKSLVDQICNKAIEQKTIVLVFSLFQVITLSSSRLNNKLMSLLQSEDLNVWDVCASLGYQATKRDLIEDNPLEKVDIVNLANYLNECLHEIANFIGRQESQSKQLCVNGFYQIVINFTNLAIAIDYKFKNSQFLRLFNTVQEAMYIRNKSMNYNKLLNALKASEDVDSIETQLKLYVLLVKINYLFGQNKDLKDLIKPSTTEDNPAEVGSEFSSEFGIEAMVDEERERAFREELTQHVILNVETLRAKTQEAEEDLIQMAASSAGIQAEPMRAVLALVRTLQLLKAPGVGVQQDQLSTLLSQQAPESQGPLEALMRQLVFGTHLNQEFSELAVSVLSSLFGFHVTPLATTLIQLFTHLGLNLSPAQSQLVLRIRNLKLIQVELYKVCKDLECDGAFEHLNEHIYQDRNLNLYYIAKYQDNLNRDQNESLKVYNLDTLDLQFDFSLRKHTLFWDIAMYSQSGQDEFNSTLRHLSEALKINLLKSDSCETLSLLCSVVLKTSSELPQLNKQILQIILALSARLLPFQRQSIKMPQLLLQLSQAPPDCSPQQWMNTLNLLQLLYKTVAKDPIQQTSQIKKRRKKGKNSFLEIEPISIHEYLKYSEKQDGLIDQIRVAIWAEVKKIWEYDLSALENIAINTVNFIYKKAKTSTESLKTILAGVQSFLQFLFLQDENGVFFRMTLHLADQALKELSTINPTIQSSENIGNLCFHAQQLLNLFYINKSNIHSNDIEKLSAIFAQGFYTIMTMTDKLSNSGLQVEQRDTITESFTELCFLIINFTKHLENDPQIEQRQINAQNSMQSILSTLQEVLKQPTPQNVPQACTFKPSNQNQKQHFFRCRQCPSNRQRLMEICSACAYKCHINHELVEYDGYESGFCDCGASECCQAPQKLPQLLRDRQRIRRPQPRKTLREEELHKILTQNEEYSFHDLERQMMSRFIEQDRLLRGLNSPGISFHADSVLDIEKESSVTSSSQEQKLDVESSQQLKKSGSESVSLDQDDEDEEDIEDQAKNEEEDESLSAQYINAYEDTLFELRSELINIRPLVGRGRGRSHFFRQPIAGTLTICPKPPRLENQQQNGSDVESLYPSEVDNRSVTSSSLVGQAHEAGSTFGRGPNDIEDDLGVYRGVSRFFSKSQSEVQQAVIHELMVLLAKDRSETVIRELQTALFYLCKQSILKYLDLADLEGQLKSITLPTEKRNKNKLSRGYMKEKIEIRVSNEPQVFEISSMAENNNIDPQVVTTFILDRHHLKMEPLELNNELKKQQDHLQHRQQIIQLPFLIRQMVAYNGDQLIAVACHTSSGQSEIRMLEKSKLLKQVRDEKTTAAQQRGPRGSGAEGLMQIMRSGSSLFRAYGDQPGYLQSKINVKFPIVSILFNPNKTRELLICGLCDLIIVSLKKDGAQEGQERVLITRSQQLISKVMWVPKSEFHIAYLAWNSIIIFNTERRQAVSVFTHSEDEKLKDFCILSTSNPSEMVLLSIDFYGTVLQQPFSLTKPQNKSMMVHTLNIPDIYKGKNKTSFCVQVMGNTNVLFLSYKNGSSLLCQLVEQPNRMFTIKSTVGLDAALTKARVEMNLLCAPQMVISNKDEIFFTALMLKQSHVSNQTSFHRGQLGLFELKGRQLSFQVMDTESTEFYRSSGAGVVDSYVILDDQHESAAVLAIVDNRLTAFLVGRIPSDWQSLVSNDQQIGSFVKQEERGVVQQVGLNITSADDKVLIQRLQARLKELLTPELIQELQQQSPSCNLFKPQQDFALKTVAPVDLYINGQAYNGLVNAPISDISSCDINNETLLLKFSTQHALSGFQLQFAKVTANVEVIVLGIKEIKHTLLPINSNLNVPLSLIESTYSALNQELMFKVVSNPPVKLIAIAVYMHEIKQLTEKVSLQKLVDKISAVQAVAGGDDVEGSRTEQNIRSTNQFQYLDLRARERYLTAVVPEDNLFGRVLLDALDMVSVSLLNSHGLNGDQNLFVVEMVKMLEVTIKSKYNNEETADKILVCAAKRLLKIVLTAYRMNSEDSSRVIWGHEYDYKTICDTFLFDKIRDDIKDNHQKQNHLDISRLNRILKKLSSIADKRFPQLFYMFYKYPQILKQIALRVCQKENENHQLLGVCLQMLIRLYIYKYQYEINKKSNCYYAVFDEIGDIVDNLSAKQQRKFQTLLLSELVIEFKAYFNKGLRTRSYDYAIDVYKTEIIQPIKSESMILEENSIPKPNWWAQQQEELDLIGGEIMDDDAILQITLELSRSEQQGFAQLSNDMIGANAMVEEKMIPHCQRLVVVVPDVYEGFIQWVIEKVQRGLSTDQQSADENSERENSCVVYMIHTLFTSLRQYSRLRYNLKNYSFDLVHSVWSMLLSKINQIDVMQTTNITKNPDFSIKLIVVMLIYANAQLKHSDDAYGVEYLNSIQGLLQGVNETVLRQITRLQSIFAFNKGSLLIVSQRMNEQMLLPVAEDNQTLLQLKREESEFTNVYKTKQPQVRLPQNNISNIVKSGTPPPLLTYVDKAKLYIKDVVLGDETQGNIGKLFEIADQVMYVQLIKLLVESQRRFPSEFNNICSNKNAWGTFICQALLNPITKHLASRELKTLLSTVMVKEEYFRLKDFNLYTSELIQIQEAIKDTQIYQNQKTIVKSLKMLCKIANKRQNIWKQFNSQDTNSILLIKQTMRIKICTNSALLLLELMI